MVHHRLLQSAAPALLVLALAGPAAADPATAWLKPGIDRVLAILEDPAYRGEARTAERRLAIRAVTEEVFDWTEMARRALGRHWGTRSEAERQEFTRLFRDLVERAWIGRIERYRGQRLAYGGDAPDGDGAVVRTRVETRPNQEVAIDYRVLRRGDRLAVWDVVVEGISLVSNYRTQFDGVIRASSYEELVKRIRTRTS